MKSRPVEWQFPAVFITERGDKITIVKTHKGNGNLIDSTGRQWHVWSEDCTQIIEATRSQWHFCLAYLNGSKRADDLLRRRMTAHLRDAIKDACTAVKDGISDGSLKTMERILSELREIAKDLPRES